MKLPSEAIREGLKVGLAAVLWFLVVLCIVAVLTTLMLLPAL